MSIVATALLLNGGFTLLGLVPPSGGSGQAADMAPFKIDYTFFLNIAALMLAGVQMYWSRQHKKEQQDGDMDHGDDAGLSLKRIIVFVFIVILLGGIIAFAITDGTSA